jgi:hypothetical protein
MRQLLSLLFAAALGSGATIAVISVRSQKKSEDAAPPRAALVAESTPRPAEPAATRPAERGEEARPAAPQNAQRFGGKMGGKMGGMLADVEGVSPENMNKIRAAFPKAFQSENLRAARNKLMELGKQAEYASEQEKLGMRQEFEDAMEDMRKATREALAEADPSIPAEVIDQVLAAVEERRRAQGMQGKKK